MAPAPKRSSPKIRLIRYLSHAELGALSCQTEGALPYYDECSCCANFFFLSSKEDARGEARPVWRRGRTIRFESKRARARAVPELEEKRGEIRKVGGKEEA